MILEERICACGCLKKFRCLPTSATRYSSQQCMEVAGVLPPVEKFVRGPRGPRTSPVVNEEEADADGDAEDSETPLLLDDNEEMDSEHHDVTDPKNPPEIDPTP